MQDTWKQHKTGLILFGITFLLAPFFYQPNLGGEGLSVSHNTTVWVSATLLIVVAVFTLLKSGILSFPKYWLPLLAMPTSIIICGFLVEIFLPSQFLLRELYILGGLFFLFALFQFRFNTRAKENLLKILVAGGVLHALYGISQILWPGISPELITYSTGAPYSTFQQINLQASYQSTVLIICLYLLSRPMAIQQRTLTMALVFSAIFLSCFIIAYSGSRVGLLSAIAGIFVLFTCRLQQFFNRKSLLAISIALILAGTFNGKEGLKETSSKLQTVANSSLEDSRKNIYAVAIDLFTEQPIQGYGIGSFQKEWHKQKAIYVKEHPNATLPPERLSHPHNEIMFWLVEGGILAVAGILISFFTVVFAAIKCGWRRGLSYLAMLLPIGLHTQVELPFYISNVHWFMMMSLIFILLCHSQSSRTIELSKAAKITAQTTAIMTFIGVTFFMGHSIQANNAIVSFLKGRSTEPLLLKPAMENAFFKDQAELYFMRTLLMREVNTKGTDFAPRFIEWAEPFIEYTPVPQLHIDLAQAYLVTGQIHKAIKIIDAGAAIYPTDNNILKVREHVYKAAN